MNKKSLTFNELLGLIIAAVLFFFLIMYPGSKLYAAFTKQEYINSYNKLTATIVDIGKSEKTKDSTSTDLVMEEGSGIFAIGKSDKVYISFGESLHYFEKPVQCEKDKSCICLCNKGMKQDREKITCNDYICKSIENIDFGGLTNKQLKLDPRVSTGYESKGGLMFGRGKMGILIPFVRSKINTVYIQKIDNNIVFCFEKSPCIEEK